MKDNVTIKESVKVRYKSLANGSKSIFLDIYIDGCRRKEYLKLYLIPEKTKADKEANRKTLELANAVKAKRTIEIQNKEYGFQATPAPEKINLCEYILSLAEEELEKTGNKRSYYYTLHSLVKHLVNYAGKKTILNKITPAFIRGFIRYLRIAPNFNQQKQTNPVTLSKNTQENLYKKFAWVLDKAVQRELLTHNPFDKIATSDKPKPEMGTREFLTVDEVKRLIQTPCKDEMLKRAFLFCCLTGLRFSDVKALEWKDFYKGDDNDIHIRIKIRKTARYEDYPLSNEALKWLPEQSSCNQVFSLSKNDNANKKLQRWCKRAGIKKRITFHCSRHTAATLNLNLGIPIEVVSKLMGHTKISTTQIYAKIVDKSKQQAVHKQDGLFSDLS